ncbi:MAG: ATPase, T2SS/T4P/T4SS family [Kiritimatiellae bacterium]|nr:ATPase, T2SS/T4P/T4SS family [Kiritimatiellia bacterium]
MDTDKGKSEVIKLEIRRPEHAPDIYEIGFGVYPVGSEKGNKIIIPDKAVDARHAILIFYRDGFWVEDLNSRSGTYLNGARVHGRIAYSPGQAIRVGNCLMIVQPSAAVTQMISSKQKVAESQPIRRKTAADGDLEHNPRLQKCEIKKQIHAVLLERLDIKRLTTTHIKEKELLRRTRESLEEIVREIHGRLPDWIDAKALIKEIFDEAVGLGPLEDLLADPEITEIMVNRHDQVFIEKKGKLLQSDLMFMDDDSVLAVIERIVAPIGRRIDESQPYVDARLKDGSRVNAIIPPLALTGPCLTIRKFSKEPLTMADLIRFETIQSEMAEFLHVCVLLRKNIVVSGGTGSGKTSFLNVLGSFLPESERIVTIEDAAELRLTQPHVVRLESRPPNIEGRGAITIRDLLRNTLRMRPDRILIGECRGGEALDMLQAMNTGHDGSITTVHANSPRDVIARLETMTLMSGIDLPSRAIREQITSAIHLIIHTARMSDGTRKVTHITEVSGQEGDRITMQDIFTFTQSGIDHNGKVIGVFKPTGAVPTFMEEIGTRGLSIDRSMFMPL